MQDQFITYNTAVLLWEFGFDEPCQARFNKGKQFQHNVLGGWYKHNSDAISVNYLAAPLFQQVQEWFRVKYFMDISVKYECSANEVISMYGNIDFMINKFRYPDVRVETDGWLTHNQMLELIFNKAFEILKEQKKTEKDLAN